MDAPLAIVGVLTALGGTLGALLLWADHRWPHRRDSVVDAIDARLPQTQCAQCGYPGCRPYAEAVARGEAVNLCPPGGEATQQALARLLNRQAGAAPPAPPAQVARIDEAACIGCFRCVEACPVDAIVGAPQLMHTVLAERCTGCELCLPPCPVDCIDLLPVARPVEARPLRILARPRQRAQDAPSWPCIRCGRCEPVCPEHLSPQELHWFTRDAAWDEAAARGLDRCIECGLCNQACPSNIDLLSEFTRGRQVLAREAEAAGEAADALARHQRHLARKAARADAWAARRRARIESNAERPWLR